MAQVLRRGALDAVINVSATDEGGEAGGRGGQACGYALCRTAVDFGVPMLTNIKTATLFPAALVRGGGRCGVWGGRGGGV